MAVDLDRGVMIRFHPSGMKVLQYIGNAEGKGAEYGKYFDERGDALDPVFAKLAGYDVERDVRKRLRAEKLAAYRAKLDAEMQSEDDALAQAMSDKSKYDVRPIGGGQFAIFDKAGKQMTKVAMSQADAEVLIGRKLDVVEPEQPSKLQAVSDETADLIGAELAASVG